MTKPVSEQFGGGFEIVDTSQPPAFATPHRHVGEGDRQGTPLWLYRLLREEFRFDGGDLFADHGNAMSVRYWTIESSILTHVFENHGATFWANPPYSRGNIGAAARVIKHLADIGNTVVGLTRAEPTAKWWHTLRPVCSEVRLLDTRLTFRGQDSLYNFPCWVWVAVPPVQRPTEPHVWFWDAKKKYDQFFGGTL